VPRPKIEFNEEAHKYFVEGEEYPSVTTIIKATVPVELSWWGMEVGVAGVAVLIRRGLFPRPYDPAHVVELLKEQNLTTNSIFWKRGESGTAIHKAFEDYGKTGKIPDLNDFPEEDHNRVGNLAAFILENEPEFVEQEIRTASLKYRYAGTFDARLKFHAGEYKGKECAVDIKTGKYVYPESQFPQLEAYENAEVEAGMAPTDYRLVLHLPVVGSWTLTPSCDTIDDFLVLMDHWRTVIARRQRLKEWKAAEKKRTGINTGVAHGHIR
jgi:hypothetical protein